VGGSGTVAFLLSTCAFGNRVRRALRRGVTKREAQIEKTPEGHVPVGGGWFLLNLRERAWETIPGFGIWCGFDDPDADPSQPGVGVHVHVLEPGEANGYYHAEAAQEGFLVLSGECIAVVEGEERRMRHWDYLHSPPGTEHITIGAGLVAAQRSSDELRAVRWSYAHD
jgi:mannose-6-phosphate isomerase-like protein (cupin superfamily)